MPKISSTNNKLLIRFVITSIVSTALLLILVNAIMSVILLKLDVDLKIVPILELVNILISSFFISQLCLMQFKNNFLPISVLSQIPLITVVIINFFVNSTKFSYLIIKIILIVIISAIAAIFKITKKKRK